MIQTYDFKSFVTKSKNGSFVRTEDHENEIEILKLALEFCNNCLHDDRQNSEEARRELCPEWWISLAKEKM